MTLLQTEERFHGQDSLSLEPRSPGSACTFLDPLACSRAGTFLGAVSWVFGASMRSWGAAVPGLNFARCKACPVWMPEFALRARKTRQKNLANALVHYCRLFCFALDFGET